jgi:putative hydrolases of HD superfamily
LTSEFEKIFSFVIEIEKLKAVRRRTKTNDRFENSAEHSWQVALLALSLAPYSEVPINVETVVKMLLIHDICEIDAGDKFIYDANHEDFENEHAAVKRIFGLLPQRTGETYLRLWEAFEQRKSPEAIFARAMDRLMPVLQNLFNNGQSWIDNGIYLSQVLEKNRIIGEASQELWSLIQKKLLAAQSKGHLK